VTVEKVRRTKSTSTCVVVGGGLLGLSAAWALARRGADVVVLEAGNELGHQRSGSKGDARIFRLGYPDRLYVEMAMEARELWVGLESRCGRTLLHETGQVTFGAEVEEIATSMQAAGAPFERLRAHDVGARYPGITVDGPTLLEPASGVLAARECLHALCDDGGFEVRTGVEVTSLHDGDREVSVRTTAGDDLRASVVVNCAGPRALSLMPSNPRRTELVIAAPSLPQVAYFRAAGDRDEEWNVPVFIEWGPDMIYGLPVPTSYPRVPNHVSDHADTEHADNDLAPTYKVSHHTQGSPLSPFDPSSSEPLADDDPALVSLLASAVSRLLPGLDPEPVATERCVYDNTHDSDFVIDRVGRIVVGCGTSGHGFKFGPLLGEMMSDLAMGTGGRQHPVRDRSHIDLRRFSLLRTDRRSASDAARSGRSVRAAGDRR
jgi:sarcosine oxidase